MSRKRKADNDDGDAASKRIGHSSSTSTPRSARSALAVQQANIEFGSSNHNHITSGDGGTAAKPELKPLSLIDNDEDSSSDEGEFAEDEITGQPPGLSAPLLTDAQLPKSWKRCREIVVSETLAQSPPSTRLLITGSQGAGKNAFARFVAKTLLYPPAELGFTPSKSLAMLHLDPSRGVEGLVGHVSLQVVDRNPNSNTFDDRSSKRHERNIPVGLFGQKEDERHFTGAVAELLREFQQLSNTIPMIVCCPSLERESERGIHSHTLQSILHNVDPHHICFVHNGTQSSSIMFDAVTQMKQPNAAIWELETILDGPHVAANAADVGQAQALRSYFGDGDAAWDTSTLSSRKPFAISYDDNEGTSDVGGIFIFGDVPPNHPFMVSRLLNCSVVAITVCSELETTDMIIGDSDKMPYLANRGPSCLLRANTIGLGFVRSIDTESRLMHIVTPDNVAKQLESTPAEHIFLVHGVARSPTWALVGESRAGLEPAYLGKARKGMQTIKSRRFKRKA